MSAADANAGGDRTPLGNRPLFEGGVQEVAERTFAWIQPNGELGESNAGLVVAEGTSVLIDTLWDERLASRMSDALAPVHEGAPIATVINTHGDGDHWYGNGLFQSAEIVATEAAAEQMRGDPPASLTRLQPVARAAGLAAAVPLMPGRSRLRGLAFFGKALSNYRFEGIEPRLPTRTFTRHLELDVGERRLELTEVGPAHTPGDAIVWVPDVRVVFSGDIVFNGVTPILWAGPAGRWIDALQRIIDLEPSAVVPGHGPVCDLERVRELIGYWEYLLRHVPEDAGDAVPELTEELVLGAEYRTSPWGSWRSVERTLINVAMIARERGGETGPVSLAKRISLIGQMGALRERLDTLGTA